MTEKTVPVPVSLIEDAAGSLEASPHQVAQPIAGRLRALLSQPTLNAEPMCTCGHEARTHDAMSAGSFACHVLECRCRTFTATPPSIEDMAPGTTFVAQFRAPDNDGDRRFTVMGSFWVRGTDERWHVAAGVDPSTIRDVVPPE